MVCCFLVILFILFSHFSFSLRISQFIYLFINFFLFPFLVSRVGAAVTHKYCIVFAPLISILLYNGWILLMSQLAMNSEVEGFLNTFWVFSFELGDLNNFSLLRKSHLFCKKKKKKTVTLVVNNQFRMHINTHLLELVLVTRVVMVLEEAILALMVAGGGAVAFRCELWPIGQESFLLC